MSKKLRINNYSTVDGHKLSAGETYINAEGKTVKQGTPLGTYIETSKPTKIVIILFLIIGFLIGWRMMPHSKIISQTIYNQPEQEILVDLGNGWKCDEPTITTDLLQPSGYWVGSTINCWKLKTPIEEYSLEMCKKTKDNYWCDLLK